jgi:hypothetical protein
MFRFRALDRHGYLVVLRHREQESVEFRSSDVEELRQPGPDVRLRICLATFPAANGSPVNP